MLPRQKVSVLSLLSLCGLVLTLSACNLAAFSTPVATAENSPAAATNVAENVAETSTLAPTAATPIEATATAVPPTAMPTPAPTEAPITGAVRVVAATLYNGPATNATVMGKATGGSQFSVLKQTEDANWLLICCPLDNGAPGWVQLAQVQLDAVQSVDNGRTEEAAQVARLVAEAITVTQPLTVTQTGSAAAAATTTLAVTESVSITAASTDDGPDGDATVANALQATITGDLINLRGGPGTNYAVVGQARAGETFEIRGRNADASWWQLCCNADESEFWVLAELLESPLTNDALLTQVALAEIPPTPEAPPPAAAPAVASVGTGAGAGLPGGGGFGGPGGTNPLTGLGLPGGRNGQRPIIVCINNDFAARPQLGTGQADVMYEYLMEGYGITRFSGIFYGDDVGQIGPVRSARLINYYMGALYDAGLACSGASDAVRYLLKHEAPFPYMDVDLDDPSNTRYSVSIGSDYRTRLRTSTGQLRQWLADWGVEKAPSIRGFTFGNAPGGGAPAASIAIPYPGGSASGYQYDGGSGRYLRFLAGSPHVDGASGAQIGVENVIIQYVTHEATDIVEDSLGSTSIRLNLFGSGRAIVFRDGQAFEATWRSESRGDLPRFYLADGQEVALKPGRTWISVAPASYAVSY
ncbi:MAG: DUF3048 domain-containing protein [Caldilineaceae bacterium]